jgi:hypothetical protein
MKKLVCIGDSHASFFSGEDKIQLEFPESSNNKIPFLEGVRLGAVLAYSLHKNNTQTHGREKLFEILSTVDNSEAAIVLCFGEIDCRFHLLRQAEMRGCSLTQVVSDCVGKYFQVIMEVRDRGFEVLVWNSIPSSYDSNNPEYPHYGTHLQRNECTMLFNKLLGEKCKEKGIFFIDIFGELVDKGKFTKRHFLFDGVHLGQLAMPFFLKKIGTFYPHLALSPLKTLGWRLNIVRVFLNYKLINLRIWIKQILKYH